MARRPCSKCGQLKPHHHFRLDKRTTTRSTRTDGRRSQCIECESAGDRNRYLKRLARRAA